MARYVINDDEIEAMYGLPHAAQVLYLRMRARMDYRTGIIGERPRISYQTLAEMLYVEPGQGKLSDEAPTISRMRWQIKTLVKAGLLQQIKADRQLIFRMVLADTDSVRPKEVRQRHDRGTTDQVRHIETEETQGYSNEARQRHDRGTTEEVQQTSGIRYQEIQNPPTTSLRSVVAPPFAKPAIALPDWLPRDAWAGWVEMRKSIKKPLTDRAITLAIGELQKLRAAGEDVSQVIDQSTARSWSSFYPVKSAAAPIKTHQPRQTAAQAATASFLRPSHGQVNRTERDITHEAERLG